MHELVEQLIANGGSDPKYMRIEWRNVPDTSEKLELVLNGVITWGVVCTAIGAGIYGVVSGQRHAGLLLVFGVMMFLPIAAACTIWYWPDSNQRVVIDFSRRCVVLERLRSFDRFWPQPRVNRVEYRFEEILAFERGRSSVGAMLTIHTSEHRFKVQGYSTTPLELGFKKIVPPCGLPVEQRYWFPVVIASTIVFVGILLLFVTGVLP